MMQREKSDLFTFQGPMPKDNISMAGKERKHKKQARKLEGDDGRYNGRWTVDDVEL
jgi:hypothetical protein